MARITAATRRRVSIISPSRICRSFVSTLRAINSRSRGSRCREALGAGNVIPRNGAAPRERLDTLVDRIVSLARRSA